MNDERPVLLIVDDQPTNLSLLANVLQADYRIKAATNGADALALARQAPVPEVVLLDAMMPDMDGYAVCEALKQDPVTAEIPVIFITGRTDAASETRALEEGAVDFIHKPINPSVVRARVRVHRELARYRQHLEELVQARTLELAQARDDAESANRAKTAFLGNASHEMLTPLNHITGMSYLLGRKLPPGGGQEHLATIDQATGNLLKLVKRLLDLTNLESNQLRLEPKAFASRDWIEQTVEAHRRQAVAKGLDLEWLSDPGLPDTLIGDPERLGQILAQLLDNAVKFSDSGRIRVSVTSGERKRSRLQVCFRVEDTGPGLPPEFLAGQPQPFRLGDDSLTRQHSGLGLGLALSQRLVALMGGEIHFSGSPGTGTTAAFQIELGIPETPAEHTSHGA